MEFIETPWNKEKKKKIMWKLINHKGFNYSFSVTFFFIKFNESYIFENIFES